MTSQVSCANSTLDDSDYSFIGRRWVTRIDDQTSKRAEDLRQLNSFLRGERAAVATYNTCLEQIDERVVQRQLKELRDCHKARVELLERQILRIGGQPDEGGSLWEIFARSALRGAVTFSVPMALHLLEAGEEHGFNHYKRDLDGLGRSCRSFVSRHLFSKQHRSCNALRTVKEAIAS